MEIYAQNCPNCGARFDVDVITQEIVCRYCNSRLSIKPKSDIPPIIVESKPHAVSNTTILASVISIVVIISIALIVHTLASSSKRSGSIPTVETIIGTWRCQDGFSHSWFCGFTFEGNYRFVDLDGNPGNWQISGHTLNLSYDEWDYPVQARLELGEGSITLIFTVYDETWRVVLWYSAG